MALLSYCGLIKTENESITPEVNLTIKKGQYYVFLYDHLTFKHIFKYLLGLKGHLDSNIKYLDKTIAAETINAGKWCPEVAYMPDKGGYNPDFTGIELFKFLNGFFSTYDINKAKDIARLLDIDVEEKLKIFPEYKQRLLLLAGLFASEVLLLFLEEPLRDIPAGMDQGVQDFFKEETDRGRSVVITEKNKFKDRINADKIYLTGYDGLTEIDVENNVGKDNTPDNVNNNNPADESELKSNNHKTKINKIPVKEDEKYILIDYDNILWISTSEGECTLHTLKGEYKLNKLLKEIEQELASPPFFRCHRSFIVNLEKIEEVKTWFNGTYNLQIGNDEVPVSRSKVEKLNQLLGI
ncbi:MAG: LytTR family DNA-binding domain-containing protein [Halothermotrichaceae bacterium]